MEENQSSIDETIEQISRIARKAIEDCNIPNISTYQSDPNYPLRVFYEEKGFDIYLVVDLGGISGDSYTRLSLFILTKAIYDETERILNSKFANIVDFDQDNKLQTLEEETIDILKRFIYCFPTITANSVYKAINHTLVNYFRQTIEPNIKDAFLENNFPKGFSFVENGNLTNIIKIASDVELPLLKHLDEKRQSYEKAERQFIGSRKEQLNEETFFYFRQKYDDLRQRFMEARKLYRTNYQAFVIKGRRNVSHDEWLEFWKQTGEATFPDLDLIEQVNDFLPSELAYQQLADFFGYSVDYLKKKFQEFKKSHAKSNLKSNHL